jgi:hypothetical protein
LGWNAGASVFEGEKVDVSQASPAIAMIGRSDILAYRWWCEGSCFMSFQNQRRRKSDGHVVSHS